MDTLDRSADRHRAVTPDLPPELVANIEAYRGADALQRYTGACELTDVEALLIDAHFQPSDRVLDLACGGGRTTVPLYNNGYRVIGLDLSDPLIESARARHPQVDFRVGTYCDLPFEDASFDDILISFNGLDLAFPEAQRQRALAECARVLVPGGRLLFSSHNIKSLHASPYYIRYRQRLAWMLRHAVTAFRRGSYVKDLNGQWTFFASQKYVRDETERAGFDLVDVMGLRQSRNGFFNTCCSPWIHYVCVRRG